MPLPSGINQPFDSPQGVKRQTKIQFLGGAVPVGPTSEAESSPTVCLDPDGVAFDVFGPYKELIASTLFVSQYMTVNLDNEGGFDVWNALVQISTGPIGFENIQIPGLAYIDDSVPFSANETGAHYGFPIDPAGFPAGVRVSARVKQVNGAQVNPVGLCINISLLTSF
jgi:hypothetical protein